MAKHIEKVIRTAEDLTTLEVNTIIKRSMTGAKPPDDDKEALYRLAGIYSMELERLGNDYSTYLSQESDFQPTLEKLLLEKRNLFRPVAIFQAGGVFSFREISIWAGYAEKWLEDYDTELTNQEDERIQDRYQLKRIAAKCVETSKMIEAHFYFDKEKSFKILNNEINKERISDVELSSNEGADLINHFDALEQLQHIPDSVRTNFYGWMNRYLELKPHEPGEYDWDELDKDKFLENSDGFKFDLRHRLALRKSIDIGVELIVMQTRIGMDGDITTRLTQTFSDDPKQFILDIHNTSIRISVGFWEKIFDALMSFLNNILSKR